MFWLNQFRRHGQKGTSIVGALVATGIVAALAVGIMQVTEQGYKTSADLSARQEMRDLRDEFYVAIKKDFCGIAAPNTSLADKNI